MRPSLRQLEYLVAVAERRSFHKAATNCHVSQPGLSTQIQQLEDRLGIKLLERSQRGVMVTPAGEEIVRRARRILNEISELVDTARTFTHPMSGTLRLGVIPTIAPYFLPSVLSAVRTKFPDLRLLLYEEKTSVLVQFLNQGKLDLLLLALEAELGDAETVALFRDPFVVAVPADHRLARHGTVEDADLAAEQVLLLEDGHCLRDQVWKVCERGGAHELGDFRATSLNTLMQMVSSRVGITLLPSMSLEVEAVRNEHIQVRRFNKSVPFRTVGMAWRKSTPRKKDFQLLAAVFSDRQPIYSLNSKNV